MLREFANMFLLFGRTARMCHNGRDATEHVGTEFAVFGEDTILERMLIQARLCTDG